MSAETLTEVPGPRSDASVIALLAEYLPDGAPTPCRTAADTDQGQWISDSAEVRAVAAARCGDCPLWRACAAYAVAIDARSGIYAGHDTSTTKGVYGIRRIAAGGRW